MNQPPQTRVNGAARRELPYKKIARSPCDVACDRGHRSRPQHEVAERLVEREKVPGRQSEREKPQFPIRHARLQDHRRQPDLFTRETRSAQRQVFPKAAVDVIGSPASLRRREFGNHLGRQIWKERFQVLDRGGDQVIRSGREEDLDLRFQIKSMIASVRQECRSGNRSTTRAPAGEKPSIRDSRTAASRRPAVRTRSPPWHRSPLQKLAHNATRRARNFRLSQRTPPRPVRADL